MTTDTISPEFTVKEISGLIPLYVEFENLTTGSVDNWLWDFGGGNTSKETNPTHIFTDPGTYDVWLYIENEVNRDSFLTNVSVFPEFKWNTELSQISHLAEGDSGCVYAADRYRVYKINSNGKLLWTFHDGYDGYSIMVGPDGSLYYNDAYFVIKLSSSGELLWKTFKECYAFDNNDLSMSGKGVIYVACKNNILAINEDGEKIWNLNISGIQFEIVIDEDGNLFVCSNEGKVFKVSENGEVISSFDIEKSNDLKIILGGDNFILIRDAQNDKLKCIDEQGNEKWTFDAFFRSDDVVVIDNERNSIFRSSSSSYSLDSTGNLNWQIESIHCSSVL